jgi:hypothetical protein
MFADISYSLVTAEQFAQALENLAKVRDNEEPSASTVSRVVLAPDPKRRADICRIAAILMYKAGVRPYELSCTMLSDLSILCADASGNEASNSEEVRCADLLITANSYLKRKTRLSRRLILPVIYDNRHRVLIARRAAKATGLVG